MQEIIIHHQRHAMKNLVGENATGDSRSTCFLPSFTSPCSARPIYLRPVHTETLEIKDETTMQSNKIVKYRFAGRRDQGRRHRQQVREYGESSGGLLRSGQHRPGQIRQEEGDMNRNTAQDDLDLLTEQEAEKLRR